MRVMGFTLIVICVLASIGCGPLKQRASVPVEHVNTASIEGFENVRYWGDEPSDGLSQSMLESWDQERAAYALPREASQLPDAHCLAISGGGSNGAFGAGILCGWSAKGDRPTFKIVTGISTGALTAPFAFLGPKYDTPLREVYTTVNETDIAIFQGFFSLLRADSAYDTAPLSKLAEKYFTEEMLDEIAAEHRKGRRLFIGTTNLDAQRPVVWDIGRIACSDAPDRVKLFRRVLLASAAIPAAFPPVYLKVTAPDGKTYEEMHVDGGVTREMFLLPSELRLLELRDKAGLKRKTHLHIIRNARYGPEYDSVAARVGTIAERSLSTLIKAQAAGDLWTLYYEAKENDMRYALASIPDDFVDDSKSMFDSKYMSRLFDRGFYLARTGESWRTKPSYTDEGLGRSASTTTPPATADQ